METEGLHWSLCILSLPQKLARCASTGFTRCINYSRDDPPSTHVGKAAAMAHSALFVLAVHQSKPYLERPLDRHGVVYRAELTHSTSDVHNQTIPTIVSSSVGIDIQTWRAQAHIGGIKGVPHTSCEYLRFHGKI